MIDTKEVNATHIHTAKFFFRIVEFCETKKDTKTNYECYIADTHTHTSKERQAFFESATILSVCSSVSARLKGT